MDQPIMWLQLFTSGGVVGLLIYFLNWRSEIRKEKETLRLSQERDRKEEAARIESHVIAAKVEALSLVAAAKVEAAALVAATNDRFSKELAAMMVTVSGTSEKLGEQSGEIKVLHTMHNGFGDTLKGIKESVADLNRKFDDTIKLALEKNG